MEFAVFPLSLSKGLTPSENYFRIIDYLFNLLNNKDRWMDGFITKPIIMATDWLSDCDFCICITF